MICQHCLETYESPDRGLDLSADHINVLSFGLYNAARRFFSESGEALFIDEVHKYPKWSIEIKNILDVHKEKNPLLGELFN